MINSLHQLEGTLWVHDGSYLMVLCQVNSGYVKFIIIPESNRQWEREFDTESDIQRFEEFCQTNHVVQLDLKLKDIIVKKTELLVALYKR